MTVSESLVDHTEAASVLLQLWREARSTGGRAHAATDNAFPKDNEKDDLGYMSSLAATPCLPDSDEDTADSDEHGEDDKLTWKRLRSLGWTFVPGSRLGESLIDFFYLAPGITVERAVKYKNAFDSTQQVQAYLESGKLPSAGSCSPLGKRRRDSPMSDDYADPLDIFTPKRPRAYKPQICGVMSKRNIPCPHRRNVCPYHGPRVSSNYQGISEEEQEEEMEEEGDEGMRDDDKAGHYDELCGVVSQRGLQCTHRREVCPYHTDAQRLVARRMQLGAQHARRNTRDGDDVMTKKTRSITKRDVDTGAGPGTLGVAEYPQGSTIADELELCGVISQRGLACTHRRNVCPYHSQNGTRRARDNKRNMEQLSIATPKIQDNARHPKEGTPQPTSPSVLDNGEEEWKYSWKDLRRQGWSYVPGSRLGEALIDFFYLPPGVAVENAIKHKNAFDSMDQVQAYLTGEALQPIHVERKRRRDSPHFMANSTSYVSGAFV